jgi:hypothetical protein
MYAVDNQTSKPLSATDKVQQVTDNIKSSTTGNPLYYPIQNIKQNYSEYVDYIGENEVKKLVMAEANKIAMQEGSDINEVLKREGFPNYATD